MEFRFKRVPFIRVNSKFFHNFCDIRLLIYDLTLTVFLSILKLPFIILLMPLHSAWFYITSYWSNQKSFTMLEIILKESCEEFFCRTIVKCSITVHLVIQKVSFIEVSRLVENYAHATLFVIFPHAVLDIACSCKSKNSTALPVFIKSLALIEVTIWIKQISFNLLYSI